MHTSADSLGTAASASPSSGSVRGADARLRVRVNGRDLHVPLAALAGVAECPALARVPAAPAWLLGVGELRGGLLPVVDLAAAEAGSVAPSAPGPHVLLVEVRGQTMGFSVSDVSVEPDDSELSQAPEIAIMELAAWLLKSPFTPPEDSGQTG